MNTQNYTVDEQIYALSRNIKNVVKMAYANYEIGSKEFVKLIDSAEVAKKEIEGLKAKGDSEEKTLNRLNRNIIEKT